MGIVDRVKDRKPASAGGAFLIGLIAGLLGVDFGDDGFEGRRYVAGDALQAERFETAAQMAVKPAVLIEVDVLALGHLGFELFERDFERRGPAAQAQLRFAQDVLAAEIRDMHLSNIALAPRPD